MKSIDKFTGKAIVYDKARLRYAGAAIDALYQSAGFSEHPVIADIGSGTGILTRALLEHGSMVYAVEPNRDMRLFAEKTLSEFPLFKSIDGTAENTTLQDGSVDFVMAAQAFHWFDPVGFRNECSRILKPGGRIVLIYNHHKASAITEEYGQIQARHCPDFNGLSGWGGDQESILAFFNHRCEMQVFANDIPETLEHFIEGNLSASYALKEGDPGFPAFLEDIKALFSKYAEKGISGYACSKTLRMPYNTVCYIGV